MPHSKDHEGFQEEGVSAEASGRRALEEGDQTETGREEYKVWNRLRRGWGSATCSVVTPQLLLASARVTRKPHTKGKGCWG